VLARITPLAQAVAWKSSLAGAWLEVRTTVRGDEGKAVDEAGLSTLQARINAQLEARLWAAISSRIKPLLYSSVADVAYGSYSHDLEELYERYDYFDVDHLDGGDLVCSSIDSAVRDSIMSFDDVRYGAVYAYLAQYYAPNAAEAFDCVSQRLCGYWLGKDMALLVRRPRLILRDGGGALHNETGHCIEFADGWKVYAWRGVHVPQKVILAPQTLTARDFFRARDLEVRRVIQGRMGERFASAMGGSVIDSGPRGALYEMNLPGDPDRRARYVRVRDTSTAREYFLRVPPGVSTVDEAIAWTFGVAAEDYQPTRET